MHWSRLPKKVVESPSLDVLKSHWDMAFGDMVWGNYDGAGVMIGLNDPEGLFEH